jgi:hypothetical protein
MEYVYGICIYTYMHGWMDAYTKADLGHVIGHEDDRAHESQHQHQEYVRARLALAHQNIHVVEGQQREIQGAEEHAGAH